VMKNARRRDDVHRLSVSDEIPFRKLVTGG
jgi:hypothetical protein